MVHHALAIAGAMSAGATFGLIAGRVLVAQARPSSRRQLEVPEPDGTDPTRSLEVLLAPYEAIAS